jgi:drug/metabolite transporter (DMT)-like permease
LVFVSAVTYAIYLIMSGQLVQRIGAMRLVGLASSVASVCCALQFLWLRPMSALWVPPEVFGLSLVNATLCTVVPLVLIMMAIERIGAALTSQAGMIGPMATIALGVWLLDEPATALDQTGVGRLVQCLQDYVAAGGLCLFTSHQPLPIKATIWDLS